MTTNQLETANLIQLALHIAVYPERMSMSSNKEASEFLMTQINSCRHPRENQLLYTIAKYYETYSGDNPEKELWSSKREVDPELGEF